jgi:hypothetical protein
MNLSRAVSSRPPRLTTCNRMSHPAPRALPRCGVGDCTLASIVARRLAGKYRFAQRLPSTGQWERRTSKTWEPVHFDVLLLEASAIVHTLYGATSARCASLEQLSRCRSDQRHLNEAVARKLAKARTIRRWLRHATTYQRLSEIVILAGIDPRVSHTPTDRGV